MRFRANWHLAVVSMSAVAGLLTGCAMQNQAAPLPQRLEISGTVMGGALPVHGSHVYLYRANTQGWAGPGISASGTNAAASLLVAGVKTSQDANGNYYVTGGSAGNFSVSGDYAACTAGQELYLYATGGNAMGGDPTQTGGINGNNAAIGLLADLGECTTIGSGTKVTLNEMTTVAAAYALSGFATDATHIADDEGVAGNTTAALAKTGMANAFANANNLATLATGAPLSTTPGGNGTVPTATLNTIANILADCVQSNGYGSFGPCYDLFTFTGTASTMDTATAAILLAQHPAGVSGSMVTAAKLFDDIGPQSAFSPSLANAPNDFLVAVSYTGDWAGTGGTAIDAEGNIWLAVGYNNTATAGPWVVELSSAGAAYTATSYPIPEPAFPLAVDANGEVWAGVDVGEMANGYDIGGLYELTGSGTSYTATAVPLSTSIMDPFSLAFDGYGSVWLGTQNGLFQRTTSGVVNPYLVDPNYPGSDSIGNQVDSIAVDSSNRVWAGVNGYAAGPVDALTPPVMPGSTYTSATYGNASGGIEIGSDGGAWVDVTGGQSVLEYSVGNSASPVATVPGGNFVSPAGDMFGFGIDGRGNLWVVQNVPGNSSKYADLQEYTSTGAAVSPAGGFTGTTGGAGGTSGPLNMANLNGSYPDGSGNVWIKTSGPHDHNAALVQFVGAGVPVVTPLVNGVVYGKVGARP